MKTPRTPGLPVLNRSARRLALTTIVSVAALTLGTWQTVHAAPHGPGGHGQHESRDGMGMGMGSPRHLDRMLDSVKATAEQRTQIQQIMATARADLKGPREQAKSLRDQEAALFTQPTVDARAAETLRAQIQAQADLASKRMLQARLEVSRVLSPEQRQQLAEQKKQRQAMMARHHSERMQLETRPSR